MEKIVELFATMFREGFTLQGLGFMVGYFAAGVVCVSLLRMGQLFSASLMIRKNKLLQNEKTFLSMQRLGGQCFTGKFLCTGWFKTWILSTGDGELIEFSTIDFNQSTKKYKTLTPEDAGEFAEKTAASFGL